MWSRSRARIVVRVAKYIGCGQKNPERRGVSLLVGAEDASPEVALGRGQATSGDDL
jgi:hypothetical protein